MLAATAARVTRPARPSSTRGVSVTVRRLVVALVCLGLLALAAPALAHAELESSTPAAGAAVDAPVRRVVLRFNAPVDPPEGGVELLDRDGEPVPATVTTDGAVVRLRPGDPLAGGTYGVRYAVTAADAHTTGTSFTFRVRSAPPDDATDATAGAGGAGAGAVDDAGDGTGTDGTGAAGAVAAADTARADAEAIGETADVEPEPLAAALQADPGDGLRQLHIGLRAACTALAFAAVGVLLFLVLAWEGSRREARMLSRLVTRAALGAGLAAAALAGVATARAAGGWGGAIDVAPTVISGRYAAGVGMRVAGALLVLAGTGRLRRLLSAGTLPIAGGAVDVAPMIDLRPTSAAPDPGRRLGAAAPALLGAALLVGSFALVGHAADAEPQAVSMTAAVLHTLAGAAWGGGLLGLVATLGHRHRSGIAIRAGVMATRFSSVATFGVVTAGAAGVALATVRLGAVADLWTTRYGLVLMAKTAVVAVVAGIGAYNHLALIPRLACAHDPSAERRLRRLGLVEVTLVSVVLGITAALVELAG